jgi:ribonuclease VapC
MFLDASAIVAILKGEDEAVSLVARMKASNEPLRYSSLVVFEVVVALARQKKIALLGENAPTPPDLITSTQTSVEGFLRDIGATEIALSTGLHRAALDAAKTYGRFVGHPAKLNFGDCFSYACAKQLEAPLLFIGDDFAQTDIEVA